MKKEITKDIKEAAKYPEDFVRYYDDDMIVLTRNGHQDPLFDYAMAETGLRFMASDETFFQGALEQKDKEQFLQGLEKHIAKIRGNFYP